MREVYIYTFLSLYYHRLMNIHDSNVYFNIGWKRQAVCWQEPLREICKGLRSNFDMSVPQFTVLEPVTFFPRQQNKF